MFNGLKIGSSGMKTAQRVMDNVADQIANTDTSGYKKKEVRFSELLRNEMGENQVMISENARGAAIGAGSRAVLGKTDFIQGPLKPSDQPFHLALEGRGFFGVADAEGGLLLTRNGAFQKNADGSVTDETGNLLQLDAFIPQSQWGDGEGIVIGQDGSITDRNMRLLGRIPVYQVETEDRLISLGQGKYLAPEGSPLLSSTLNGERGGYAGIRQRTLEGSGADLAASMTEMIITQRAYQVNAKSITTADEMLEVINTIV